MNRRRAIIAFVALGMSAGATAAQASGLDAPASYWGCAVVDRLDKAVCLKNPLPERLPIPATPAVPV